jgi:hypothetical protein
LPLPAKIRGPSSSGYIHRKHHFHSSLLYLCYHKTKRLFDCHLRSCSFCVFEGRLLLCTLHIQLRRTRRLIIINPQPPSRSSPRFTFQKLLATKKNMCLCPQVILTSIIGYSYSMEIVIQRILVSTTQKRTHSLVCNYQRECSLVYCNYQRTRRNPI